ncbi:hypothetical protein, partial [Cellulomonas hominis]
MPDPDSAPAGQQDDPDHEDAPTAPAPQAPAPPAAAAATPSEPEPPADAPVVDDGEEAKPQADATPLAPARGLRRLAHSFKKLPIGWQTTIFATSVSAVIAIAAIVAGLLNGPEVVIQTAAGPPPTPAAGELACAEVAPVLAQDGGPEVTVYVRPPDGCWSQLLGYVPPGTEVEYLVSYVNGSDVQHDDVALRVGLPDGVRPVSG